MDKTVFLNTAYQVIGKVIIAALGVLTVSFLTRYLGTIGYSQYSLVFSFIEFAAILPNFGLVTLLIRDLPKDPSEKSFGQILSLRLVLSIIVFLSVWLILPFLPYPDTVKIGIIIASFYGFFLMLSGIYWAELQARLKFGPVVVIQVITALITTAFIVIGVMQSFPLLYFVVANAIGVGVGLILSFKASQYSKIKLIFYFERLKHSFKKALPFAIWTIVGVAYFKVDAIMLSFYFPPSQFGDVGIYNLAYRIFEVMIVFVNFFPQTLFPIFSKLSQHQDFFAYYKRNLYLVIIFAILASFGLFFLAPVFIQVTGGPEFEAAILPAKILSIAVGASMLSSLFINVCLVYHKEYSLVKVGIVGFAMNIILNLIFLPGGSYIAAAWTTAATQLFVMIGNGIVAYKVLKEKKNA